MRSTVFAGTQDIQRAKARVIAIKIACISFIIVLLQRKLVSFNLYHSQSYERFCFTLSLLSQKFGAPCPLLRLDRVIFTLELLKMKALKNYTKMSQACSPRSNVVKYGHVVV